MVLTLIIIISRSPAQVSSGGKPYSFINTVTGSPAVIKIPAPDMQQIASLESGTGKDEPFQFGYPFEVGYDLENSGTWSELSDGGRLWRLRIYTQDAYSLNLIYDNFYLADGARLFLYSADKKMLLGAFTVANNKPDGVFATAPVRGGDCILELYEPPQNRGRSRLTVSRIIYGYKNVFFDDVENFGASGSCNIDINSAAGADWQAEKRSVAMILTGGGSQICSGALINNAEKDIKQYLLTANHCLGSEEYWIVMFNYESPAGTTEDGPTTNTVQGTTLLATSVASDFALLEITEQIPIEYNVHFAGWSAESTPATQTVCIHHPNGDVKKISFDNDAPTDDYWDSNTPLNSHWAVVWDEGTTEEGSSGSPLFDQNHRIVGQLHGGAASCSDLSGVDNFGKFSYSWDYYSDAAYQLQSWLDPQNTGVLTMDGRDYYSIIFNHAALSATEDITGPYRILATVTSSQPPLGTIWLHYGWNGDIADSLAMQTTGESNQYYADIPGGQANVTVNYYLSATDAGDEIIYCPSGAPGDYYSFFVGVDTTPPEIVHGAITDRPLRKWPVSVTATVTDNLGVDTVYCQYYLNDPAAGRTFALTQNSVGQYCGVFPEAVGALEVGDVYYYRIVAVDAAATPNIACFPESGYLEFQVTEVDGLVLIIDDDPESDVKTTLRTEISKRSEKSYGAASRQMQRWLTENGYYAEIVDVATADTLGFSIYDLIISTSGSNPYPVEDETYREKVVNWLADTGHKLLIEGGEVGYVMSSESSSYADADFAANVLHCSAWNDDLSGDLKLVSDYNYHPVVRTPQTLPDVLELAVDGLFDQDSQRPLAPAYTLYCNAYHKADGGIIIYDNNDHPQSAQTIYYAFNFALLADSLAARQLLINSVNYLLAEEKPAIGAIGGRADISDKENDSGVIIFLSGTVCDTAVTDSLGNYIFENLYDGYYELKASRTGYICADSIIADIQINQAVITDLNFQFEPVSNGTVRGMVAINNLSDYSGVEVWLVTPNRMDTTAADGSFYFNDIPPGEVSLYFYYVGYTTVQIGTTLPNGGELVLNVTMYKDLPAPRNLAAIAGNGVVTLSWQKPAAFSESFETGLPADWTIGNYGSNSSGAGWSGSSTFHYDGALSANCRYGGTEEISNEWLITNRVAITENSFVLKFWHMASYPEDDNLPNYIRVSTGTTDTADFTIVRTFPGEPLSLPGWWTQVAVNLSDYIDKFVYIAFQYQSKFGESWFIDLVTLESDTIVAESDEEKSIAKQPVAKSALPVDEIYLPRSPFNSVFGESATNLTQYRLYRSTSSAVTIGDEYLLEQIPTTQLEYSDTTVNNGQTYFYIIAADYGTDGLSAASVEVSATPQGPEAISQPVLIPDHFALSQNFPNPFNPLTTINYQLPHEAAVSLVIYNLYGQKIRTLVDTRQSADYYSVNWNGSNDAGQRVATGIYFCRIEAGDFQAVRKMLFLK